MGSGKTSVGKVLAKIINSVFIDIDLLIKSNLGMSIKDIFNIFGEKYFRDYEKYICSFIQANIKGAVISTGGGTPMFYDVRKLGRVIYLNVSLNDAISRIASSNDRPKLNDDIHRLYNSRLESYKKAADLIVESNKGLDDVVNEILIKLNIKGLFNVCTS